MEDARITMRYPAHSKEARLRFTPYPGSLPIWMALSLGATSPIALAQTPSIPTVSVTIDNYNRAQTDVNFAGVVKNGGFGKFRHGRELAPPTQQGIVRPNRAPLYSF